RRAGARAHADGLTPGAGPPGTEASVREPVERQPPSREEHPEPTSHVTRSVRHYTELAHGVQSPDLAPRELAVQDEARQDNRLADRPHPRGSDREPLKIVRRNRMPRLGWNLPELQQGLGQEVVILVEVALADRDVLEGVVYERLLRRGRNVPR